MKCVCIARCWSAIKAAVTIKNITISFFLLRYKSFSAAVDGLKWKFALLSLLATAAFTRFRDFVNKLVGGMYRVYLTRQSFCVYIVGILRYFFYCFNDGSRKYFSFNYRLIWNCDRRIEDAIVTESGLGGRWCRKHLTDVKAQCYFLFW